MVESYRKALHIATSDSLTGLYNHRFLHEHLASLIGEIERGNRDLSVAFFDVMDMAAVNRHHGSASGDHLLRQVGGLIGVPLRGEDLAARYGGEEFCVVMPATAPEQAEFAIRRIANVIASTEFALPQIEGPVCVKLAVGLACLETGETPEALIARAHSNAK